MSNVLKIENVFSRLMTDDQKVKDVLWGVMRHRERGYFHNARYRLKLWDGYIDFFKKDTGRFLTGLLPEVRLALKKMNVEYELVDNRDTVRFKQEEIGPDWLNLHLQPGMTPVELRDYQIDYVNQIIRNKRGIVYAPTACHRQGSKVLMYDGTIKKVEDIVIGDQLMGPDSKPRNVLQLCRGTDTMYKITPRRGDPFFVNGNHYLTLKTVTSHRDSELGGNIVDVTVNEYLNWSKWKRHIHKLFRVGVEFNNKVDLPIDPYFLGLLLGDGSMDGKIGVATVDKKNVEEVYFSGKGERSKYERNFLVNQLKLLGLKGETFEHKFIPLIYKTAPVSDRLKLLAGLLDTDGHFNENGLDFISKSQTLSEDVVFLARSLGFHANCNKCYKKRQTGGGGFYYRVYISGVLKEIPCKIKCGSFNSSKNVSVYSFEVEKVSDSEEYYGFLIDEDQRYLLDDFLVTHNSGKTNLITSLLFLQSENVPTLVLANRKSLVNQNYEEIKMWGIKDVGRFYGEHKEINRITCATVQSAHLLKDFLPKVECLIVDEIHEMISKKPKAVYLACKKASVRVGLSATPFKFGETDKVQKYEVKGHIGPAFRASNTETGRLTTKELQERNILASAECVFYPVHDPVLKYHVYTDAVTDGIANNHYLHEMTCRLVKSLEGRTLIIVERISHGDQLQAMMLNSLWVQGKDDLDTRKSIIERLKKDQGKVVAIATSGIFNTGINVFCHNLINCAGGQADHMIIQRFGRGLRVADDKKHLKYYDWYFTNNQYLEKHSDKRIRILEKEGHTILLKEKFDL